MTSQRTDSERETASDLIRILFSELGRDDAGPLIIGTHSISRDTDASLTSSGGGNRGR